MSMHGTVRKTTTPGSLYRLIYRSREVIARSIPHTGPDAGAGIQRAVRAIVSTARNHNKDANVTGALLFTEAGFVQVLEGPRDIVERTFERIAADPRHTDVTVLSFTPALRRSFPDWPMGFYGQTPDPDKTASANGALLSPRVTTGAEVLKLLERLVQQEDAWIEGCETTDRVSPAPGNPAPGR
jgi:hypothetical protein